MKSHATFEDKNIKKARFSSLVAIVIISLLIAVLAYFICAFIILLPNTGHHRFVLEDIIISTVIVGIPAGAVIYFLSRKLLIPIIKRFKIQGLVLKAGKDGIGTFLGKEKDKPNQAADEEPLVWRLWNMSRLGHWIYTYFDVLFGKPPSSYRITYSYTDENGEEHTRITYFVYLDEQALAFERLGTFPIKFIGDVSAIVASKQSMEEAILSVKQDKEAE